MSKVKLLTAKNDTTLAEPVFVSFPGNTPSTTQLDQVRFDLFEQKSTKKRVLKSQFKSGKIKYEASSTNPDVKTRH